MRIMAQVAMVMNLDKCLGCHTCSVTCKQTWTNRPGTEYAWFNNVETKPGSGYPYRYEDQQHWHGGWTLGRRGKLKLKAGGRIQKLLNLFHNPDLPALDDYYEPWTYDYEQLISAPLSDAIPTAAPKSRLTGAPMVPRRGPNWDDDLAGTADHAAADPNLDSIAERVRLDFENAFMFYLPRICEHCLNPSCVASCPSGAMYKRVEDGIVLVDQDRCRGWRFCVSGCPYKKVYFNHQSGKAEKCTFCYPRVENGQPTICSETCVGRLRHLGVVLYDADAVTAAASVPEETELYPAQLSVLLDPHDPQVIAQAERDGITRDWVLAAQRSPVYALIKKYRVALPLHPEYRTLPMVWYVPPLSPVIDAARATGRSEDPDDVFATIDELRIPVGYLANLFTAGDPAPVERSLRTLTVLRNYMRGQQFGETSDERALAAVGLSAEDIEDLYRILAIAKYDERYVIPRAHAEHSGDHLAQHCPVGYEKPDGKGGQFRDSDGQVRFNLLGWNGSAPAPNLFGEGAGR
ncbi:nitrate reductase subunit beta [Nocardia transvalensis]|uniref:nitrate reductase subunit beta n=1 Tax=Nocardia transvalensis TaxID=37333 RepID=UPI0018956DBC|nr:nitrate reductase subunit beta [Nocardia transvalensis]MBF6334133.1 nitrate reductase subunit beta [Nocardia transvalensis]